MGREITAWNTLDLLAEENISEWDLLKVGVNGGYALASGVDLPVAVAKQDVAVGDPACGVPLSPDRTPCVHVSSAVLPGDTLVLSTVPGAAMPLPSIPGAYRMVGTALEGGPAGPVKFIPHCELVQV